MTEINNFKINSEKNQITISVNPVIYSLPVITLAANDFIYKLFVTIDGNIEH